MRKKARDYSPIDPLGKCLHKERPPKSFSKRGKSESSSQTQTFAEVLFMCIDLNKFISPK